MIPDTDPLHALATTNSPEVAAWAVEELRRAGFTEPERIVRDFGWIVEERQ